ncbi:MAG: hypothetical protein JST02_08780 [Bacteroidetes bacterium]|nr:hypothetical protein [Bacteroidota bacterium]
MRTRLLPAIAIAFISLATSCKKVTEEDNCNNINNSSITATTSVEIGQPISINIQEVGGYRVYSWIGPDNFDSQYPENSISYAELKHEGWYYVHIASLEGDCEKSDSVYIDVKLNQGNPSCTVANNTTTFNNLPDDSYNSVQKMIESSLSLKVLEASGPLGANMTVYFHPNWRTKEPEDGIYTTINTPLFDQIDNNYNKVFITTTKQSIYWACWENQTVYVSHVAGKLQVRFCNFNMGGSNGSSGFTTVTSGNIVEQ